MPDYPSFSDRPMRARTFENVQKELLPLNLPTDLVLSIWHRLNGRIEEAESYMQAFYDEQEAMQQEMDVAKSLAGNTQ